MICPGPVHSELLRMAATSKANEVRIRIAWYDFCCYISLLQKFGEEWSTSSSRMAAERCARLSLVAVAHGLPEVWVSPRPILQFLYITQYMPDISKWQVV